MTWLDFLVCFWSTAQYVYTYICTAIYIYIYIYMSGNSWWIIALAWPEFGKHIYVYTYCHTYTLLSVRAALWEEKDFRGESTVYLHFEHCFRSSPRERLTSQTPTNTDRKEGRVVDRGWRVKSHQHWLPSFRQCGMNCSACLLYSLYSLYSLCYIYT